MYHPLTTTINTLGVFGVECLRCISRPPNQKKTGEKVKYGEQAFLWHVSIVHCKIAVFKISIQHTLSKRNLTCVY